MPFPPYLLFLISFLGHNGLSHSMYPNIQCMLIPGSIPKYFQSFIKPSIHSQKYEPKQIMIVLSIPDAHTMDLC